MEKTLLQEEKKSRLFIALGAFFLTNAIVAEFIGTKLFSWEKTLGIAPAKMQLFGAELNFDMTAGVILWPMVFILTDIINEYFGSKGVRRLSIIAVVMLVYSFLTIRLAMGLEGSDYWLGSQSAKGIQNMGAAYDAVFGQGLFIIVGSLVAFLVGQMVDALIFARIRKITQSKMIWLRATGSTVVSQFIDSYVVLLIAFYFSGTYPLIWVLQVGTLNYIYKLVVAIVLTPLLYLAHNLIDRYLGKNLSEKMQQETLN